MELPYGGDHSRTRLRLHKHVPECASDGGERGGRVRVLQRRGHTRAAERPPITVRGDSEYENATDAKPDVVLASR